MVKDSKWNRWFGKALDRLLSVLMVVGVTGTPMCALADGTGRLPLTATAAIGAVSVTARFQ